MGWDAIDVDTPIEVSDNMINWEKRHFARYEDGRVHAFEFGNTSWTVSNETYRVNSWKYARLAESE